MLVYRRVCVYIYINVFSFLGFCSDSYLDNSKVKGEVFVPQWNRWLVDHYSPPQLNMEPKNEGLVQMFFLFKWVIFRFHMLVLPEVYRDPLFPELFCFQDFH